MVALTIGMATYNDFDGVYFTLQALRLYQDLTDTELLVIDNYGCDATRDLVQNWRVGRYIRATDLVGTAAPRDLVFRKAKGKAVLCCDSHVLFAPGAIARLRAYYRKHPKTNDLLQGPLVYDDLQNISTHFDPVWRQQMWGIWGTDPRGKDPEGKPFEIPMQGLGVFSCRRKAWPGFNPAFKGFGGEEGYIHEKFRQRGGRALCLPWLRWMHRFSRPNGVPYPLRVQDKLRNYLIGHAELGLDPEPALEHFAEHLRPEQIIAIKHQARQALHKPSGKKSRKNETQRARHAARPMPTETELAQQAASPLAPASVEPAANGHHDPASMTGESPTEHVIPAPSTVQRDSQQPAVGFVFGLSVDQPADAAPSLRNLSLPARDRDEPSRDHLTRVVALMEEAIALGGTHLLIPTTSGDWIGDHPLVLEYLAAHHEPVAASWETGFLFALRPSVPIAANGHAELVGVAVSEV